MRRVDPRAGDRHGPEIEDLERESAQARPRGPASAPGRLSRSDRGGAQGGLVHGRRTRPRVRPPSPRSRRSAGSCERLQAPLRRDVMAALHERPVAHGRGGTARRPASLIEWKSEQDRINEDRYSSELYSTTPRVGAERARGPAGVRADAPLLNGFEIAQRLLRRGASRAAQPDRHGRGRGQDRRRQPGLRRAPGEVRPAARHRHRHPRDHDRRPGDRHGDARPASHRRDPVPGLHPLRAADPVGRPGDAALAHEGAAEGAGHRAHARPPAGGDLAFGLAHGRHHQSGPGHLRLRAAEHDAGGGLLQHAAPIGRPGDRRGGAERLPAEGEAAGQHRRDHGAARRARGAARRARRHGRHLRRLLPDRHGGRGEACRGRDRGSR